MGNQPSLADEIAADIPCINCGYNLHALQVDGLCPECGHRIDASVIDWKMKQLAVVPARPLSDSDPRWLANLREGLWLALLTWPLNLVVLLAPYESFKLDTWSRFWMAAFAATAWVFGWLAAWKLSSPEPLRPSREPEVVRRVLRAVATVAGCLPLLQWSQLQNTIEDIIPEFFGVILAVVLILSLVVAPCLYYARCCRFLNRAGSTWITVAAMLLAGGMPFVMLLGMSPSGRRGWDGIEYTASVSIPFGSTGLIDEVVRAMPRHFESVLPHLLWVVPLVLLPIAVHLALISHITTAISDARRRLWRESQNHQLNSTSATTGR